MSGQLIVPGHGLVAEGAAFGIGPNGEPFRLRWNSTAGQGRALCACTAHSPVLNTAAARKRWHVTHKLSILDTTDPKKGPIHG